MRIIDLVLWLILPYTIFMILIMSLVWRNCREEACSSNNMIIKRLFQIAIFIFLVSGILVLFLDFMSYDRTLLLNWIKGLFTVNPRLEMMHDTSFLTKVHILSLFFIVGLLPFTNYLRSSRLKIEEEYELSLFANMHMENHNV